MSSFPGRVRAVRRESVDVLSFVVEACDGGDLPPWTPGAHIDVTLPSGVLRQYSLCGDPAERTTYEIAVLRETAGRGGSREFHDTALLGRTLTIGGPRNHFELVQAPAYRFIAGGIGVTPILPMAAAIEARGGDWRLLYGARSRPSMAFRDRLAGLGPRVTLSCDDEDGPPDLAPFLAEAPAGAAIYCCGPEGLIQAVETLCAGLAGRTLHLERFAAPAPPPAADLCDSAFEVELTRSGLVVRVPPTQTILEAVRQAGVNVPYSCATGVCGACETVVLGGVPLHRDCILSPTERVENKTMMICVGRSRSDRLVLDL